MRKGWRPTRRPSEPTPGAFSRGKSGAPGGIRTPDHLIRSQVLYPLSYGRGAASGSGSGQHLSRFGPERPMGSTQIAIERRKRPAEPPEPSAEERPRL